MAKRSLSEKLLRRALVKGDLTPGTDAWFRVDSTLVHDMSGLLCFMGFEAMQLDRAAVPAPYIFVDHNLVCMDCSSPDDQDYLRSCAQRFGLCYSRPGNGICHSLYYHRLGKPGTLLIGADSHTATAGALGMLGVGVGGMDAAVAMSGAPFCLKVPKIMEIRLEGCLPSGSCAKDLALTLLRQLTVRGGVGAILEYTGPGVQTLSVPQRATLANMGAEMGATSSIFPADETVRRFLAAQGREDDYCPLVADDDAQYDAQITLDLSRVVPMVALPGAPDRGCPVQETERIAFSQIFIGSCTNGSYTDLARAALILNGRKIAPDTAVVVSCANRQVYDMLLRDGYLRMMTQAGARVLECACGPCMGIGQAPASGAAILRTSNRNYPGRSGTKDAQMYLSGTEVAAASAVTGYLTDPRELLNVSLLDQVREPDAYPIDDSMFLHYEKNPSSIPLRRGANIRPVPVRPPMEQTIAGPVSLKLADGVSTDDIVPPDPKVLTLRPNIPELSKYIFHNLDPDFAARAAELQNSMIVAGEGYAQGSSREHAAIGCMYLGVRAVLCKSIHRIHRANLINYGVLPLLFENPADYDRIEAGDVLELEQVMQQLRAGPRIRLVNRTKSAEFYAVSDLSDRELMLLQAGGLIPLTRAQACRKETP